LNIYTQKRRWKLLLFIVAAIIVTASLWYTNILVGKIARQQRQNIKIWAEAVQSKATLVTYQEKLFSELKAEERKRVELLAEATRRLIHADNTEDITFFSEIIADNTTIPVILTDDNGNISSAKNVDFSLYTIKQLSGKLKEEFSVYPPIAFEYYHGKMNYFYYANSRTYTELKTFLENLIESFITEVVTNAASVPVIITDSSRKNILAFGNLDSSLVDDSAWIRRTIGEMSSNPPIIIDLQEQGKRYIYYQDSYLLNQLRYYPIIQFGVIGVFLFISYLLFSVARRSEQNKVWAGMAKETAHQLGTPLSSLMAWVEYLKLKGVAENTTSEIEKDIVRLDTIAQRFSKIGSPPKLETENLCNVVRDAVGYLKPRTSKNIQYKLNFKDEDEILLPLNRTLLEWVVENLCRNAVDAMDGRGTIEIDIIPDEKQVFIDISDTGKGIPKNMHKSIFNPGFTSKQRGWGLGLTLSRRIIEYYHRGRIFVKSSTPGKGTTFRILVKR
jgi:signal transduction histidine kinase